MSRVSFVLIIYCIKFAEFFKDLKKETSELKEQDKKRVSRNDSENQPPRKRRRTVAEDTENFKAGKIRLEFRRKYNTRNSKKTFSTDGSNDSENEDDEENHSSRDNRPKLQVLFPWAKPFQRTIDLMKMGVCDVDEEEEETYDDDTRVNGSQKRNYQVRVTKSEYDPDNIPSVDEITEDMLENVAKKSSLKTWCKIRGTSCHQCRQKTLDTKTICRSGECVGVRGQFCGPCLQGRYGESAVEALKDPVSLIFHTILVRMLCKRYRNFSIFVQKLLLIF